MWEDDGNVQKVEVEQSATAFFKTIHTRMHVVQVSPHQNSHLFFMLSSQPCLLEHPAQMDASCSPPPMP